jgi:hypothetical protein
VFSGTSQPVYGDITGGVGGIVKKVTKSVLREPIPDNLAETVKTYGFSGGGTVFEDRFQSVDVECGIFAAAIKQWNSYTRYGPGFHIGKDFLKDGQAAYSDDRFDLARLDEGHDKGELSAIRTV